MWIQGHRDALSIIVWALWSKEEGFVFSCQDEFCQAHCSPAIKLKLKTVQLIRRSPCWQPHVDWHPVECPSKTDLDQKYQWQNTETVSTMTLSPEIGSCSGPKTMPGKIVSIILEHSPEVGPNSTEFFFLIFCMKMVKYHHIYALILISPIGCSKKTSFWKIFNFSQI